jgi:phosphodiesterase/alkaline phosphatase D-like protein
MNKLRQHVMTLTFAAAAVLSSNPAGAQSLPAAAARAARVEITQAPALERASQYLTIIRWATNNPGGLDDHYAIVRYGTDPSNLSQTALNHVRLNRAHPETTFRVRLLGLKPSTTYYYRVTSIASDGTPDGVESEVKQFTMPAPGASFVAATN